MCGPGARGPAVRHITSPVRCLWRHHPVQLCLLRGRGCSCDAGAAVCVFPFWGAGRGAGSGAWAHGVCYHLLPAFEGGTRYWLWCVSAHSLWLWCRGTHTAMPISCCACGAAGVVAVVALGNTWEQLHVTHTRGMALQPQPSVSRAAQAKPVNKPACRMHTHAERTPQST